MRLAKVLEIKKYDDYPRDRKTNRIVLIVEYDGDRYYLDVTDELQEYGIGYDYDVEKLKKALPEYIEASFMEIRFKISKKSMKEWMFGIAVDEYAK